MAQRGIAMVRATLELARQMVDAARYAEANGLLRSVVNAGCGMPAEEPLAAASELCGACNERREDARRHWRAAAAGTADELGMRAELAGLIERAIEALPDEPPRAAELTVRCLGPLEILHDGRDLGPVPNRRARSLLRYLLLHRGRVTPKEALMDLFWPDAEPAAARNNLNVAVHGLRRYLRAADGHDGHVLFQGDGYLLNPELDLRVDLDEFHRLLAAAQAARSRDVTDSVRHLESAEALHRGCLFADELYEDWTAGPRRDLADRYVELLRQLAGHYRDLQDDASAARVLRKVLDEQPADEPTHRELMRCYARLGQRHLALRQFHDCVAVLDRELDLTPDPETVRAYAEIRAVALNAGHDLARKSALIGRT
jgi:DNA-binding SARP family transcriptional activator